MRKKNPFPPPEPKREGYKIVEVILGDGSKHYELRDGAFVLSWDWGGAVQFKTLAGARRELKRQQRKEAKSKVRSERVVS